VIEHPARVRPFVRQHALCPVKAEHGATTKAARALRRRRRGRQGFGND
jgi:hypothetical protein